ncbi:MAG TPA: carbonic anhydrase family protein [Thermoanaerobaculia bacterium]|nr:carbonic anhydrase family protein [Thermoanaerobaculia bacterium]
MKITRGSFFVFLFALTVTLAGPAVLKAETADACAFGFEGAIGPDHWWEICAPKNLTCAAGQRQSPIDLPAAPAGDLLELRFGYHPTTLEVENTGTTIEVPVEPGTSVLKIGKEEFELLQFHFHTPSEHRLQGEEFPMELHFVHRNALGELAVVGVFLKEGAANPVIQQIWDHAPTAPHTVSEEAGEIDPEDLLPVDRGFYRYAGSLTTPPCSEGVRWHVLQTPVEISAAQVDEFRAIFPVNARPLQLLNGRPVLTDGL